MFVNKGSVIHLREHDLPLESSGKARTAAPDPVPHNPSLPRGAGLETLVTVTDTHTNLHRESEKESRLVNKELCRVLSDYTLHP